MTFAKAGFRLECEDLGRSLFLHSLEGNGGPAEFAKFLVCVLAAVGDRVLFVTVRTRAERLYKRLGFVETGEDVGGHKVLVRTPRKETLH